MTQVAIKIIKQKETPAEMAPEVHHWLKCLAGRVLVRQFASSGPNAAVHEALVGMIGDQEMSLEDRCSIAGLLKEMDYSASQGLTTATAVTVLGDLAQAVTSEEADHARDFKEELLRGSSGQFQQGRFSMGRGGKQDLGPHYERRRLLDRLLAITHGIEAVSAAADPDAKGKLQALAGPMRPVIASASEKGTEDVDLVDPIIDLAREIDNVVRGWKSADGPAKEKAADEFS